MPLKNSKGLINLTENRVRYKESGFTDFQIHLDKILIKKFTQKDSNVTVNFALTLMALEFFIGRKF